MIFIIEAYQGNFLTGQLPTSFVKRIANTGGKFVHFIQYHAHINYRMEVNNSIHTVWIFT